MKIYKLSITLVLTMVIGSAFAEELGLASSERQGVLRQKLQARIQQQADTNHDGVISKEEFMVLAEKRFIKMDGNGDGQLNQAEFVALREKLQQLRGGQLP
ncbi:MAG: EF-hand domain-containing protein [Methylococcaceae bacterium]|jgi:Ca2+-binding EF-hand superfamily protein